LHVMKTNGYKHQKHKFRVFRQSLQISQVRDKLEEYKLGTGRIRVISIKYQHVALFSDVFMRHRISCIVGFQMQISKTLQLN
jgi:hypothetical protein